ncbi:MAG: OmpA family protein [Chitinophagales bacterium]
MQKSLLCVLLLILVTLSDSAFGQNADKKTAAPDPNSISWRKNRKLAKKLLKKGSYFNAVNYLEAGAAKKPKKAYFPQTLSQTELQLRDYKSANKWYKLLVDQDSVKHKHPEYIFQYALTQKYLGQYEDAKVNFAMYRKLAKDDDASVEMKKRATREIEGAQLGIHFRDSVAKPAFKVRHLDAVVNQPLTELSPVLHNGALYYGSLRSDNVIEVNGKEKLAAYSRIYKSMPNGKEWTAGEELGENINAPKVHTGNPTFSADGNTMYFTKCIQDDNLKMKCMIMKSNMVNGIWEKATSAGTVNDPLYSNSEPAVGKNKDGEDVVYFVSDRNPGKGLDIFYSKINTDGSLAKPRSAGPQINSKGDEMSPFFEAKTNTLYFSSNGWINIGGMDVFKTSFDNGGEWTEPENMGMPVNSSVDDIYFTINDRNTQGFVVSNRPGGFGLKSETCCDDIYEVQTSKIFLAVRGSVYEEINNNRMLAENGMVTLYDDRNGLELSAYNLIGGKYFFDLEPEHGYKLVSRKDTYRESVLPFSTDGKVESDTFQFDLFLKKKEDPIIGRVIGKVYYDYDKSKLREDARDTLKSVTAFLEQNPQYVIEVGGHTDGKGKESYNDALAKHRSEAVVNYFIYEKKMKPERFVSKAYGATMPAASNTNPDGTDNPTGRALNRRTEFKVVDELKNVTKEDSIPMQKSKAEKKNGREYKKTEKEKVKTTVTTLPKENKEESKTEVKTENKTATAAPVKETKVVKKEVKKIAVPVSEGYTETVTPASVKGKVYTEKGGKRLLAADGIVFLSNADGSEQKTFYVKADGTYSFDMSRAGDGNYKLVARKGATESKAVNFSKADLKSGKAMDLVIEVK